MSEKNIWISSEPFLEDNYQKISNIINNNKGTRHAIIECFQQIPCNPCEDACPQGAISVGNQITELPVLDIEKCTGCGICISKCPGQAIFVIDTKEAEFDRISIPYEYLPLPVKGQIVTAVDRRGRDVCRAKVIKTMNPASYNKTAIVSLEVPNGLGEIVRGIKIRK